MKKCLMQLLATTLIIILAGCSGKELNKEQDINDESETEKTESNGNKNKTGTDITPIETELDGAHNGMFVVTIDGKKYRYRMAPIQNNNLTIGDMIYKWDNNKGSVYEFYAVKEHPDYKYLKCISNENVILIITYFHFERGVAYECI